MKNTNITLKRIYDGACVDFEIDHATRILTIPMCGWELPENSNFTFDIKNGIERKPNTRSNKKSQ